MAKKLAIFGIYGKSYDQIDTFWQMKSGSQKPRNGFVKTL